MLRLWGRVSVEGDDRGVLTATLMEKGKDEEQGNRRPSYHLDYLDAFRSPGSAK